MIVVETTILVYALGGDHPLRAPCRALVGAVGDGRVTATTTVEVIQEFAHVRSRRRTRREAAQRAEEYAALLAPLLRPDRDDLAIGLGLFADDDTLGAFDAVVAATARRNQRVRAIASADKAFAGIDGLTHLDPAATDFVDRAIALGTS